MSDYYIGRQPIFDANMDLFAYELLFRNTAEPEASINCGEAATSQVMSNALTEIGLENLVGGHPAFINLTHHFITHPDLILMPPESAVLEILEDVEVDDEVLAGVAELGNRGYRIALDDFVYRPGLDPLIEMADFIKIDITQFSDDELQETVERLRPHNKPLLAEKVETIEEFEQLQALAFDYYQGYFFAKPKIVSGKKLPSNKIGLVELASKIHQPDVDIDELHRLVSMDISLSVKALRFANSANNGLRNPVENVRQAIALLGLNTLKNWITILIMAEVDDKPTELVTLALTRARLCELLARKAALDTPENFFTAGLFSVLDALLDSDMETILETLPLDSSIRAALIEHRGLTGDALVCALHMEIGDGAAHDFCGIGSEQLNELYLQALQWADESIASLN